jgi:hypothetical protein
MVVQAETLSMRVAMPQVSREMVEVAPEAQLQEQCLVLALHQTLVVLHLSTVAVVMVQTVREVVLRDLEQVPQVQSR